MGVLGIQCKHHPTKNIPTAEIDKEIAKAEGFEPALAEFIIATSAARDTKAHQHVLKLSKKRQKQGKFTVTIKFWDDIYGWLTDYPDLIYKHFTRYFPTQDLENIHISNLSLLPRKTSIWPTTLDELTEKIDETIHGLRKVEPYVPIIGVSTFPDVSFDKVADLEIRLDHLLVDESRSEASFIEAANVLNQVKTLVRNPYFSSEVWLYPQVRLSLAFLLGWVFRRVSHFSLGVIFGDQFWVTGGLPHVRTGLSDGLPRLGSSDSKEAVVVLSISRDIETSVLEFVGNWDSEPSVTLSHYLDGFQVTSAAHALSLATTISQKLKTMIDRWGIKRIHLFGALPAALAVLIGFHLNAICPISIYFLDHTRTQYRVGGTLTNGL